MSVLDRKLLRESRRMWLQLLAIVAVLACGIAAFVAMLSIHQGLEHTRERYYESNHFAQVFARVSRAPRSLEDKIRGIEGVAWAESRVVQDVTIAVEGFPELVTGRLNSLPAERSEGLNRVHLVRGRMPRKERPGETLVSEAFAAAHELEVGDRVEARFDGRERKLEVVGVAMSPEFVYELSSATSFPDPERFGVFWMGRSEMEAAFDMESTFNDVSLTLTANADDRRIRAELDRLLEPYGGNDSHGRDLQTSHRMLDAELQQLQSSGVVTPIIFLGVAAFLINIVLSRIVATQREQIAAMKAIGYGDLHVGLHYAKLVGGVVALGSAVGILGGAWMGRGLSVLYAQYFHFPGVIYGLDWRVAFASVAVSCIAVGLGTFRSIYSVVKLPPAEAMRAPPPAIYSRSLFEFIGVGRLFSTMGRMVLRNLGQRPLRSAMTSLGIAFAVAILVIGNFSADAMEHLIHVQFSLSQRDDMTVIFSRPQPHRAFREIEREEGVLYAEPFRAVGVRLRNDQHSREVGLTALPVGSDLRRLRKDDLRAFEIPPEGLVLTDVLAKKLGVREGETVWMEVLEGRRGHFEVPVTATLSELVGFNAYMAFPELAKLLREDSRVSGVLLSVQAERAEALHRRVVDYPGVATAVRKRNAIQAFMDTSADMQNTTRYILLFFASIIAIGVVYNSARIILSERARDLSSLRVLGFTRSEVSRILLGEFGTLLIAACPIGWLVGYGLMVAILSSIDTELYRLPVIIQPSTFVMASAVVITAGTASAIFIHRRITRLDLVTALKSRE